MALDQSALLEVLEVLKVADVGDRVRQAAETVYQALIEAELTEAIGAALHERTDTRTNLRNGHRPHTRRRRPVIGFTVGSALFLPHSERRHDGDSPPVSTVEGVL